MNPTQVGKATNQGQVTEEGWRAGKDLARWKSRKKMLFIHCSREKYGWQLANTGSVFHKHLPRYHLTNSKANLNGRLAQRQTQKTGAKKHLDFEFIIEAPKSLNQVVLRLNDLPSR